MAQGDNNNTIEFTLKSIIKGWFETGKFPTQTQFHALFDSFWHKGELIPTSKIAGLDQLLQQVEENSGTNLTNDQLAAVQNAPSPSGTNHFITQNEINPLLHPIKTINATIIPDANGNAVIPLASLTNPGLVSASGTLQQFLGQKEFRMSGSVPATAGFSVKNSGGTSVFSVMENSSINLSGVTTVSSTFVVSSGLLKINGGNLGKTINQISLYSEVLAERNISLDITTGNVSIGNVLGGTTTEKFEVYSTTSGAVPAPRMTQAQKIAIVAPKIGSMVTQTDGTVGIYTYTASGWKRMLIEP